MTRWSHPVASFWAGGDLSFIEQMVLASYLEQGCDLTLYVAGEVGGIPAGVAVRDASEILPKPGFVSGPPTRHELAVWSDLFRVALLRRREVVWVDMDAYCLAPYASSTGYLFGLNDGTGVLSGVVALPVGSAPLRWLEAFLFQAELVPPWRGAKWIAPRREAGRLAPAALPWGDTGPRALTHALELTGTKHHAAAQEVFYPLFRDSLRRLWTPGMADSDIVRSPDTLSVHIFGYTKRFLTTHHGSLPPPGSWLARRARAHGIDPAAAPALAEPLG